MLDSTWAAAAARRPSRRRVLVIPSYPTKLEIKHLRPTTIKTRAAFAMNRLTALQFCMLATDSLSHWERIIWSLQARSWEIWYLCSKAVVVHLASPQYFQERCRVTLQGTNTKPSMCDTKLV
jgi:hypothetical protein